MNNTGTTTATVEIGPFPGQRGPHTAAAHRRLKDGQPGDFISVEEMSAVVGRDCHPAAAFGYRNVLTAIRGLRPEVVWEWDRGRRGWVCLDPCGRLDMVNAYRRSAARKVRCALGVAMLTDPSALDPEARRDLDVNRAVLGMMALTAAPETRKKLTALEGELQQPEPARLLELMRKKA